MNDLISRKALIASIQGTVSEVAMTAPYDPIWFTRLAQRQVEILSIIDNAPAVLAAEVTTSCEDPNTEYITFPDGLRLIVREGVYAGWYVCREEG